jgi:hypothetical protein
MNHPALSRPCVRPGQRFRRAQIRFLEFFAGDIRSGPSSAREDTSRAESGRPRRRIR